MNIHDKSTATNAPLGFQRAANAPQEQLMNSLPAGAWNGVSGAFGGLKTNEDKYAALTYGAALAHYGDQGPQGLWDELSGLPEPLREAARRVGLVLAGHRSEIEASGLVALFAAQWGAAEAAPAAVEAVEASEIDTASEAEPDMVEAAGDGDLEAGSPDVGFTVLTSAGGDMTKHYSLSPDGSLSAPKVPNFVGGFAGAVEKPLHQILDGLTDCQCIVGGLPDPERYPPGTGVKIVPQKSLADNHDAIARSKETIAFRKDQPALMLFDRDPNPEAYPPVHSTKPSAAYDDLLRIFPALKGAAALFAPSASSGRYIRESDDAVLRDKHGVHGYFPALDGSDIHRAGEVAFKRMINTGRGSIALARNGAFLVRGPFDRAVFSGERIDYCAPATVGAGIRVEGRGEACKIPGGYVDTKAVFQDLTAEEEKACEREIKRLKAAVPGDVVKAKRDAFEAEMVEKMVRRGASPESAREHVKTMRPGHKGSLGAGVVLEFDDFGEVTAAEVLANLAKFDRETLADPIEGASYGAGKAKLFVNDDGSVVIHSFAHGGVVYWLRDAAEAEKAAADSMPPWVRDAKLGRAIEEPLRAEAEKLKDRGKMTGAYQKARRKWLRRVETYVGLGVLKATDFAIPREGILQLAAVGEGEIKPSQHALALARRAIDLILARELGLDAAEEEAKRATDKKEAPAGMGEVEAEIIARAPDSWSVDGNGVPVGSVSSNLMHFLAYHLGVYAERDDFQDRVIFKRLSADGPVTDAMLDRWNANLDAAQGDIYRMATDRTLPWGASGYEPRSPDIGVWVRSYADERGFNSATDRLMAWDAWDGVDRLHDWGARYFGYVPTDPEYQYVTRSAAHMLRGFAGRILRPGVQFDEMLVLLGLQGERKTSLVRLLGNAIVENGHLEGASLNFNESTGHNHIAIATAGKVIVEMGELKTLQRRDAEDLKRIISRVSDTGRALYGKATYTKPRQFIMVGTANVVTPHDADAVRGELASLAPFLRNQRKREIMADADLGFLVDESGNRRFLPIGVMVNKIDLDGLGAELPQLIAQAKSEVIARNFDLTMDPLLEEAAGQFAGKFRATGDMCERISLAIAKFDGDISFAGQDMIRVLDLRADADKVKMRVALRKMGFGSYKGNHGLTRYYRGSRDTARRLSALDFMRVPAFVEGATSEIPAFSTDLD